MKTELFYQCANMVQDALDMINELLDIIDEILEEM